MKKLILGIAVIIFFIVGSSCDKDQKLISEIEGTYMIETIVDFVNGQATSQNFTNGQIFFEDCRMKDGTGGNCKGWYEFDGKAKVNFQYLTVNEKSSKLITISNLSSFDEPKILGTYKFKKDGDLIFLDGVEQSGSANGVTTTFYSDIKLSKK